MSHTNPYQTAEYEVIWADDNCSLLDFGQRVLYKFSGSALMFWNNTEVVWQVSRYTEIPTHRVLDGRVANLNPPGLAKAQI